MNQICLASSGGPAGPATDGWLTLVHVGNAGVLLRDSVEGDEYQFPLRVLRQRLIPDSEGAGRWRGAPSVEVEFAALDDEVRVIFACDGNKEPAAGARGGLAGGRSSQAKRKSDGSLEPVSGFASVLLRPGESVVAVTCGGGGYGSPLERDPARVAEDAREGWITSTRAVSVYGVVLDADRVDEPGTARQRASLARKGEAV